MGEERDQLGGSPKAFASEDVGVKDGGDGDVQRLAMAGGLVVRMLYPAERR